MGQASLDSFLSLCLIFTIHFYNLVRSSFRDCIRSVAKGPARHDSVPQFPTFFQALAVRSVNLNVNIENFGMHFLFQTNACLSTENQCVSKPSNSIEIHVLNYIQLYSDSSFKIILFHATKEQQWHGNSPL